MSDQRLDALEKANKVRTARARIRRDLYVLPKNEGRIRAAELVCQPPRPIEGMTVVMLLGTIRGVGPSQVKAWLRKLSLTDLKIIGQLTERQRREVAELLTDGVPEGMSVASNGHYRRRTQETIAARVDIEVGELVRERAANHGWSISREANLLLRKALSKELAA